MTLLSSQVAQLATCATDKQNDWVRELSPERGNLKHVWPQLNWYSLTVVIPEPRRHREKIIFLLKIDLHLHHPRAFKAHYGSCIHPKRLPNGSRLQVVQVVQMVYYITNVVAKIKQFSVGADPGFFLGCAPLRDWTTILTAVKPR